MKTLNKVALTQHTTVKSGALRLHQGRLTEAQLSDFLSRLQALNQYGSGIIACLYRIHDPTSLSSLEILPLPNRPELRRLKLIEHKRQFREQQV